MTILIYLDSNDFSNLSESALSELDNQLLHNLRARRDDGSARFFASAIHISEAVHAAAKYKDSAVRRAALIKDLCGTNAFRLPSDIFRAELTQALATNGDGRLSVAQITARDGEWFGIRPSAISRIEKLAIAIESLDEATAHLPRRERRRLRSKLNFNKESSAREWHHLMSLSQTPVKSEFPINLLGPRKLIAWLSGEIDDKEVNDALISIIRDPHLVFEHLLDNEDNRNSFYQIARKESSGWLARLDAAVEKLFPNILACQNVITLRHFKSAIDAKLREPSLYADIASSILKRESDEATTRTAKPLIAGCPALSLFIHVLTRYYLSVIDANISRVRDGGSAPILSKPSDVGDFLHLAYAPYVDIFRCDARFGTLLKGGQVARERIADKRGDLVSMLNSSIAGLKKAS